MGVGQPEEIVEAVRRGIDMFDCVLPTRNARHGLLYVFKKKQPTSVPAVRIFTKHFTSRTKNLRKISLRSTEIVPVRPVKIILAHICAIFSR